MTKYEKDPQITQFVRNLTWYITPALNPDGYEYTRSSKEPEVKMTGDTNFVDDEGSRVICRFECGAKTDHQTRINAKTLATVAWE